jgi:uncharacterized membrane protein/glutaredoxin
MSSRRRQQPWMYRKSRYLIAAIAALGAINTGYITYNKFFGGVTACPTSGCEQVLSSAYAEVFGLPLALFGLLAYLAMGAFALAPLAINPERDRQTRTSLENITWLLLFVGATAMLVFSGYLMYIMFSQFVAQFGAKGICYFCLASALFALSLFVLTLMGRDWEDRGQLFFTGAIVALVTVIGTLGIYSNIGGSAVAGSNTPGQAPPAVATTSGQAEVALAKHLKSVGAKMFGAYWCPHCHDQKDLFGQEAAKDFPYVECAADGQNSQAALCTEKGVTGYPTWTIGDQKLEGTQSLQKLAEASGFKGSQNFKNQVPGVR